MEWINSDWLKTSLILPTRFKMVPLQTVLTVATVTAGG